ncbi:hypothetical protein [Hymenobacter wooponensis]|uniref:Uncharacterized protein n=1 Tax=Hymenobacter wooponensis TaxID=1525360 RepID=A0A4Z0MUE0_9BACT|nr:hypothetical protein [Hymenobacter wooponensis]TGD82877.1 hypothetical protein EU557_03595 [Hymenobacter wooponensis]
MSQLPITKADFKDLTPMSQNVADALIQPYILEAWEYDLELLTEAERAALLTTRANWSALFEKLFAEKIRPLWVLEAYRRFLGMHGIHVTPNGIEYMAADTQAISRTERVELKADAEAKASIRRGRLEAALRVYRGTVATTCSPTRRKRGRGGVQFIPV